MLQHALIAIANLHEQLAAQFETVRTAIEALLNHNQPFGNQLGRVFQDLSASVLSKVPLLNKLV
jgi:hypothetical protein